MAACSFFSINNSYRYFVFMIATADNPVWHE